MPMLIPKEGFSRIGGIVFAALLPEFITIDIGAENPMISGYGLRVFQDRWSHQMLRCPIRWSGFISTKIWGLLR